MTQDENKIYQIIYTEESGYNKKKIEWTLMDDAVKGFRHMICASESINDYYINDKDAFKFIKDTKPENLKDGDREEKWRTCKSSDVICQINGIDEIQASDFGRIRLRIKNKDEWKICPLYDSLNLDKAICKDVFIKLCKKQEELQKNRKYIGY